MRLEVRLDYVISYVLVTVMPAWNLIQLSCESNNCLSKIKQLSTRLLHLWKSTHSYPMRLHFLAKSNVLIMNTKCKIAFLFSVFPWNQFKYFLCVKCGSDLSKPNEKTIAGGAPWYINVLDKTEGGGETDNWLITVITVRFSTENSIRTPGLWETNLPHPRLVSWI